MVELTPDEIYDEAAQFCIWFDREVEHGMFQNLKEVFEKEPKGKESFKNSLAAAHFHGAKVGKGFGVNAFGDMFGGK